MTLTVEHLLWDISEAKRGAGVILFSTAGLLAVSIPSRSLFSNEAFACFLSLLPPHGMASHQEQYAFRAQRLMGLVGGTPTYEPLSGFQSPDVPSRTYRYTRDGKYFAYVLPTCVRILNAQTQELIQDLAIPNIIEITFSPLGTYLSTWERPVKLEDGAQHKNLRVWQVSTGQEVASFTQKSGEGWEVQFTPTEDKAVRLAGPEVHVFSPANWGAGIVDKLRVEGIAALSLSPGRNPAIAVFVGEKNAAPASVKIYSLLSLSSSPTCQKTFFKADKCTMKWNAIGTQVLVLTSTDVDKSNKSYYGETNMYLLSAAGTFDCRVTLDKEGPIHDFSWSPNSKEFGVVYGFMPSKTILFDQRVKPIFDFGTHPRNFISFNSQGRLLALGGFGNLAGKVDIFDRKTLDKICTIDAPNTSWCEWSADGKFLLTAVLSPRLRVDNGIKIWHCTGELMHVHNMDELYQASWRPALPETAPVLPNTLPTAPPPHSSVQELAASKPPVAKPAGAYRPPGARGGATPSIFKREDEGGAAFRHGDGYATPTRQLQNGYGTSRNGSPAPAGAPGPRANGTTRTPRHVPGAPPPGSAPPDDQKKPRTRAKGKKDKKGNEKDKETEAPAGVTEGVAKSSTPRSQSPLPAGVPPPQPNSKRTGKPPPALNLSEIPPAPPIPPSDVKSPLDPVTPGGEGLDPLAKKIRNLNKKLKAIDELKEKVKRGERMEVTQLKKIEGEAEIRKELITLLGP